MATVKARIVAVVGSDGKWVSYGGSDDNETAISTMDGALDYARDENIAKPYAVYIVEADLERPQEPRVVQGRVEKG